MIISILYAEESCYTVQLLSKTNSDKNKNLLLENSYDSSCKIMEIEKNLTVRCGCFMSMEDVEKTLPTYKEKYKNAYIMRTYKSRFGKQLEEIKINTLVKEKKNINQINLDSKKKDVKIQLVSFSKDLFDISSPIGNTNVCINDVNTLLNQSYQNYPSIQSSRELILSKQSQIDSAKWNYFPTPSINVSQRTDSRNMTFILDQPLWTGGKLDATTDLAVSKYEEAQSILGENTYTLTEDFLLILQNYIEADGQIKGFTEGKKQLITFSEMLERRISAGASSRADKELLNSRIAQIDSDLMIAISKYEVARSQLNLLLGYPLRCAIGFENDQTLNQNKSLNEMKEKLLLTHPEVKKLESQIAIAEAERKATEATIMPSVSLRAEYQNGSIYTKDQTDESLIYFNLAYTPGAGFSSISNIESAKYNVFQVKNDLETKKLKLTNILIGYYEDYHSYSNRLENIKQTIQLSQLVLKSYSRLFLAGKRQWLDLVNMSREVTENQVSMATVKAMYITAAYRLALHSGNINFEEK
jgi:adhesin transport system outer membrane protein